MVTIKVRGCEFEAITIKDAFNRRATLFKNTIIQNLRSIGVSPNDVDIKIEQIAIRKAPASVSWYFDNKHLYYSHRSRSKYVENLGVVSKVISLKITALLEDRITFEEFINEFSEDIDIVAKRKESRVVLGLDPDIIDVKIIDKAYKDLAKKHHPDVDTGDAEKFKEVNTAHKILKKELW